MDKLQMAMRFAEIMLIEHFKGNGVYNSYGYKDGICEDAWVMADAMQAEADKRAEQKRKEIREMLNADNTFIEKEGQHFDDVNFEVDWDLAPFDCDWFAVDSDGSAYFYSYKPYIKDGYTFWGDPDITNDGYSFEVKSNFGYTGNWQDSLRKRPHDL